jgi:transcriptional regulator with XRE-family HTH domain
MSQLELALAAEVSSRHLSFLETGRAQPSRQMLLLLAGVLEVPLRERNALLHAAGFAPVYRESALDDPALAGILHALELILRQHEPLGAVALDRHWNVVMTNAAYARFLGLLVSDAKVPAPFTLSPPPRLNALRLLFDPAGVRPRVLNWAPVAREILGRVYREAVRSGDEQTHGLLKELLASPGVPPGWREPDLETTPALVLPVELRVGECTVRFFTTLTTLGAPLDVTLEELRIESFHAADADTEALMRRLAGA